MKARPAAADLMYDAAQPARDQPISARVAQAHARARERGDAQRQAVRPLGAVFIARKMAGREAVGDGLRAAIERSAELAKAGLADARQAVGALRGDRLPTLDQLATLVEDFRRDTGVDATLRVEVEVPT